MTVLPPSDNLFPARVRVRGRGRYKSEWCTTGGSTSVITTVGPSPSSSLLDLRQSSCHGTDVSVSGDLRVPRDLGSPPLLSQRGSGHTRLSRADWNCNGSALNSNIYLVYNRSGGVRCFKGLPRIRVQYWVLLASPYRTWTSLPPNSSLPWPRFEGRPVSSHPYRGNPSYVTTSESLRPDHGTTTTSTGCASRRVERSVNGRRTPLP